MFRIAWRVAYPDLIFVWCLPSVLCYCFSFGFFLSRFCFRSSMVVYDVWYFRSALCLVLSCPPWDLSSVFPLMRDGFPELDGRLCSAFIFVFLFACALTSDLLGLEYLCSIILPAWYGFGFSCVKCCSQFWWNGSMTGRGLCSKCFCVSSIQLGLALVGVRDAVTICMFSLSVFNKKCYLIILCFVYSLCNRFQ